MSKRQRTSALSSAQGARVDDQEITLVTYEPRPQTIHHQAAFESILRRKIIPTLYYDKDFCRSIEINDLVVGFAKETGFNGFLNKTVPCSWVSTDPKNYTKLRQGDVTYKKLIAEVITTLEMKKMEGQMNKYTISFRMFNKPKSF